MTDAADGACVRSIFVGYLGLPASITQPLHISGATNVFEKFLEPVFAREAHGATTTHAALGAATHGELVAGEHAATSYAWRTGLARSRSVNKAASEGFVLRLNPQLPENTWHMRSSRSNIYRWELQYWLLSSGILLAYRAYKNADKNYTEPINNFAPPVYNTLFNKYYVDELMTIYSQDAARSARRVLACRGLAVRSGSSTPMSSMAA